MTKNVPRIDVGMARRMFSVALQAPRKSQQTREVIRAERRSVALAKRGMINNPNIVIYLNRLSDLLYLLARANEKQK